MAQRRFESGEKKTDSRIRASNIEVFSRKIYETTVNSKKIYFRDSDNDYFRRLGKVISQSPTGASCSNLMAKFIAGDGVDDAEYPLENSHGLNMNDLIVLASEDIATYYGVAFFVTYKFDLNNPLNPNKLQPYGQKVLNIADIAVSKSDDDDNPGVYYLLNRANNGESYRPIDENTRWFYPYNPNFDVVMAQMRADCLEKGIKDPTPEQLLHNYRGQCLYVNLTPRFRYPLPPWDAVYNDMDSEARVSIYTNTQARLGFMGRMIIRTQSQGEERDNEMAKVLLKSLGSENSGGITYIPVDNVEDVDKTLKVDQLKAQYDDKLFELTKKSLRENISAMFNRIPDQLIYSSSGGLFSASGTAYIEMKKFYNEQCLKERFILENALTKIYGKKVKINDFSSLNEVQTQINNNNGQQ